MKKLSEVLAELTSSMEAEYERRRIEKIDRAYILALDYLEGDWARAIELANDMEEIFNGR